MRSSQKPLLIPIRDAFLSSILFSTASVSGATHGTSEMSQKGPDTDGIASAFDRLYENHRLVCAPSPSPACARCRVYRPVRPGAHTSIHQRRSSLSPSETSLTLKVIHHFPLRLHVHRLLHPVQLGAGLGALLVQLALLRRLHLFLGPHCLRLRLRRLLAPPLLSFARRRLLGRRCRRLVCLLGLALLLAVRLLLRHRLEV
mmetsp:Transcript_31433/g.78917  ORF Transcript_31433/g.78917 Transcript_31433/m.78917 type:complete len:201 (+) Transcript_31433:21-623(+)